MPTLRAESADVDYVDLRFTNDIRRPSADVKEKMARRSDSVGRRRNVDRRLVVCEGRMTQPDRVGSGFRESRASSGVSFTAKPHRLDQERESRSRAAGRHRIGCPLASRVASEDKRRGVSRGGKRARSPRECGGDDAAKRGRGACPRTGDLTSYQGLSSRRAGWNGANRADRSQARSQRPRGDGPRSGTQNIARVNRGAGMCRHCDRALAAAEAVHRGREGLGVPCRNRRRHRRWPYGEQSWHNAVVRWRDHFPAMPWAAHADPGRGEVTAEEGARCVDGG